MNRIGGLWLKEGKNGKFFSGSVEIEGIKQGILIFKNTRKEGKQPDYHIYEMEEVNSKGQQNQKEDDVF